MRRIPYTPFAADFFKKQEGLTMYFLSHLHADHTIGLSSNWRHGTLYCSPVTAAMLTQRFPGFDMSLVVTLE